MKKGYIIGHATVTNPEAFKAYAEQVDSVLKMYGATTLVRGGRSEHAEGSDIGDRHIIHEFPSYDIAQAFYHGDEYRKIRHLRQENTLSYIVLVEGL